MAEQISPNIKDLSDYYKWYQQSEMDMLIYTTGHLSTDLAVGVVKLFFPDFVEYRDAVIFKYKFDKSQVDRWFDHFNENIREVEIMVNQIEIAGHLFFGKLDDQPYENIAFIGVHLVKSWQLQLAEKFPERKFSVIGQKHDEFDDFVISIWQT